MGFNVKRLLEKFIKKEERGNSMEFDYERLRFICNAEIPEFYPLGEVTETAFGVYIHKENVNSKVLAVAHLDTVLNSGIFQVATNKKKKGGGQRVYSQQLDDRLGVYTILDLLPKFGIEFDLLLTEGEETGMSTAQYFDPKGKEYNWAFSFDRRGEDVVSYQFEDDTWNSALESSGFKVGIGSFSDIAFLDDLKIKCVNIGTGYHGEHTKDCHVNMVELERQVLRFSDFYQANKDKKFVHEYNPNWWKTKNSYYQYGGWEEITVSPKWGRWQYQFEYVPCYLCKSKEGTEEIEDGILVCPQCYGQIAICDRCENFCLDTDLLHGMCRDCLFETSFGSGRNSYG